MLHLHVHRAPTLDAQLALIDVAPYVRIMYQYSRGRIELQHAVIAHVWIFNVPSSHSYVQRSLCSCAWLVVYK
uniref:Uncharacterized protein n=1 Tax=Trichogramma kaykai TaxID=54128 RepID=A0ABD2WLL7_9HYME